MEGIDFQLVFDLDRVKCRGPGPRSMATIKSEEFDGRVAEIYDCIAGSKEALVDAKDQINNL